MNIDSIKDALDDHLEKNKKLELLSKKIKNDYDFDEVIIICVQKKSVLTFVADATDNIRMLGSIEAAKFSLFNGAITTKDKNE